MSLPTLTELGAGHGFTAGDLNTDGYVAVVPAYQKVYFADGRPYDADITVSGYHKLDMINTRLVGNASGAFTQGEVVTQAVSGAKGIFDETVGAGATAWHLIYRTTTTEFDTTNIVTGADSGETVTPTSVVAPPHWLNWALETGTFPDGGSNIMGLCFGRIFMNSMYNPHHWYGTRVENPLDLLMSQDDLGSACSSQASRAGVLADELIAFIPYKDNYLILGLLNQMYIMRSDPLSGIQTQISDVTGIFSSTSWCWDDKNNLYFIGMDGIYKLSSDAIISGQPPENITKVHLPKLFTSLGLNRRTDRVTMGYDKKRYGITISCVQMDRQWHANYWLDLRTRGLFPEVYQDDHVAHSQVYFDSRRADRRDLLWGRGDGYIGKFDETEKSDDGDNAIDSWVTLGPFTDTETPRARIRMSNLSIVTGLDTDYLEVSLFMAKTAEQLVKDIVDEVSPRISRVFTTDKLLSSMRQRISGGAIGIKIGNSKTDKSWSIEKITADISQRGKI